MKMTIFLMHILVLLTMPTVIASDRPATKPVPTTMVGVLMDEAKMSTYRHLPTPFVVPLPEFNTAEYCQEIASLSFEPESALVACLEREDQDRSKLNGAGVVRPLFGGCVQQALREGGSYTQLLRCLEGKNAIRFPPERRRAD